jgi:hypothetical protein
MKAAMLPGGGPRAVRRPRKPSGDMIYDEPEGGVEGGAKPWGMPPRRRGPQDSTAAKSRDGSRRRAQKVRPEAYNDGKMVVAAVPLRMGPYS